MKHLLHTKLTDGDILIEWEGKPSREDHSGRLQTADEKRTLLQLKELENDDIISQLSDGVWSMGYDSIDQLEDNQFELLGLPMPEHIAAKVFTDRSGEGQFKLLKLDLRSSKHGILNNRERKGPFIAIGNDRFILPKKEIRDLEIHLRSGPDIKRDESQVAAQQAYHAQTKRLANQASASIESWLEREHYEFADSIGLMLDGSLQQGIDLHPVAKGVQDEQIQDLLGKNTGDRSVVWTGNGRERKRLILDPKQRVVLQELHQRGRHISSADVPDFLDTPEAFLPPDTDLSDFSDRVKGLKIKVYDSRPYIHIRQGKLNWFPETTIELNLRDDAAEDSENDLSLQAPHIEDSEYLKKVKEAMDKGQSHIIHDGAIIRFDPNSARALDEIAKIEGPNNAEGIAGSRKFILDIFENIDALEFTIDSESEEEAEVVREILEYPTPESVNATLRPFQITGYNWLRTLDHRKRSGLLADDMGLGKTLQVISYLAAMKEEDKVAPSLAILPKTLIQNWFDEIKRFCPALNVAHFSGGRVSDVSLFEGVDLVLTTYDTLRINQVDLARIDWNVVVCDEAQAIKNPTTGRTTAVKGLKSRMRIAMTGTPVENGLSELWSIMDWVQPGLLRSRLDFRTQYERPIVAASDEDSRNATVRALQERIIDHYLRRLKSEVLPGLPEKKIHQIKRPLSSLQMSKYMSEIKLAQDAGRGAMLACLQKLLLLSACPWSENEAYGITGTDEELSLCPKLDATVKILDGIRDNSEKALIFVERLAVQGMLQSLLFNRYGIVANLINGKITSSRQTIVDEFNKQDGFQVLILSPKVGGTGLNIPSANHVIHYMRPWNPAIENQATDRVHRIGQEKEVHVYLPIATWPDGSSDSVEEVLNTLINSKMALATDVIVPTARMSLDREVMEQVFKRKEKGD